MPTTPVARVVTIDGVTLEFNGDHLVVRQPRLGRRMVFAVFGMLLLMAAFATFLMNTGVPSLFRSRTSVMDPALMATDALIVLVCGMLRGLCEYFVRFGGGRFEFDRRTSVVKFAFGGSRHISRGERIQCRRLKVLGYHLSRFVLDPQDRNSVLLYRERCLAETRSPAATEALAAELAGFMDVEIVKRDV